MAINVYENLGQKVAPKSPCSKSSNLSSCVMKLEYAADGNTVGVKNDSTNKISPYLSGDKVQLHSRVTERKLIRKKTDFVSSFPLAVNIYKASSDEFKVSRRGNKKVKKSVLTLPNEPAPAPQMCTVSDMTESEYFNENKDERKPKTRKKKSLKNNRKLVKSKNADIYDRDAQYCSQLNIDLDSSSTDFINRFPGDNKKKPRRKVRKMDVKAHDVWTMLRNLNQFQFVPSAPMSQESVASLKKRSNFIKKRNSCRDGRLIETCRTEEFAYISNYVDNSHSQSSLDRVTVIDKQENYQTICQEIEKKVENYKPRIYKTNQKKIKPKVVRKQNFKSIPNNINNTENNKSQDKEALVNNICNNDDVKNETNDLKIYSIDNMERDLFCDDIDSSRTNLITGVEFNQQQQEQDDYALRKKIKQQISGITKVVVSKGNNVSQEPTDGEGKNLDLVTTTFAGQASKSEAEKALPNVNENNPQRTKRGRVTTRNNVKAMNNGDIKTYKAKGNTNTTLHKSKTNNDVNVLEKTEIGDVKTEMKQNCHLKDKMIKLLYKKHQVDNVLEEEYGDTNEKAKNCLVEFGTNTQNELNTLEEPNVTEGVIEIRKPVPPLKRTWGKGKWASDFIDTVIRKIKSGVYYSNDEKQQLEIEKCQNSKRKDSSQTDINQPNFTKAQILETKEEIIEPYRITLNPPKYEIKPLYGNKIDKKVSLNDESLYHKISALRESLNRDNFEPFDNISQVNFTKKGEYKKISKQKEILKATPAGKHSWVEGKWASDFIDNIFKKIKNGVYYTHEEHCHCKNHHITKDDSSQTETDYSTILVKQLSNDNTIKEDMIKQTSSCESLPPLPGFDDSPNELEIETYSQNQIAVKNCVTNVVVKFDVELPSDPYQSLQVKQSLSCIPVAGPDTDTKVFKSKTAIINAFLPAELCSILPMIMRNIIASNTKFPLPKLTTGKVESSLSTLSTISELTRCESLEFSKQIPCKICEPTTDLLLNLKSIKLFDCNVSNVKLNALKELDHNKLEVDKEICLTLPKKVICMALQVYKPLNKVVPAYKRFNLLSYFENLINTKSLALILNNPLVINYIKIHCLRKHIEISVEFEGGISPLNILITNISTNYTCSNVVNSIEPKHNLSLSDAQENTVPKLLDLYANKTQTHVIQKTKSKSELRSYCILRKKKGFVKLYKKCKSMSNLPNYKSSISIEKITNFEEFVKFLGSPKMFSTVIDGNMAKKIMSSLKEMKNWKTDITPRQALLVMLLANKNDTINVLRYRPIVLQGIAVNRITKTSELDMEIEVIERENLNKLSQFEGYSYLPASVENQDALLEELYWIAKTTASDYQKPFDESSERLLKSLLEKRKKLNPSYLRVMARYVGLGLLKTSK